MQISIKTTGIDQVDALFRGISERSQNLQPVFSEISDDFNLVERKAFSGSPDLVRTGDLRDALTGGASDGAVRDIDLDRMEVGTDIWYAVFHRDRLLEPITSFVENKWVDQIRDFIMGGRIRGSLFGGFFGL